MRDAPTTPSNFADRSLAELASTLAGVTLLFRRHNLNFCHHGSVSLAEAAAAQGIDLTGLEQELQLMATPAAPPALPEDTAALIALIETRYHAVHRRELQELITLARRVETVHAAHPEMPRGAAELLRGMAGELEVHMKKEELILFPRMRRGGDPMLAQPIAALMVDHDGHRSQLQELARALRNFIAPNDACPGWRALCLGARKLTEDLVQHIRIENDVLFPRFTV